MTKGQVIPFDDAALDAWRKRLDAARGDAVDKILAFARECYEFMQACERTQGGSVYSAKMEEWFGIAQQTASRWAVLGSSSQKLLVATNKLPPSMETLYTLCDVPAEVIETKVTPQTTQRQARALKQEHAPAKPNKMHAVQQGKPISIVRESVQQPAKEKAFDELAQEAERAVADINARAVTLHELIGEMVRLRPGNPDPDPVIVKLFADLFRVQDKLMLGDKQPHSWLVTVVNLLHRELNNRNRKLDECDDLERVMICDLWWDLQIILEKRSKPDALMRGLRGMTDDELRTFLSKLNAPQSVCECGHTGDSYLSQHGDDGHQKGHGRCLVEGCDCRQFTWRALQPDNSDCPEGATMH
jgi:hypothetical protein